MLIFKARFKTYLKNKTTETSADSPKSFTFRQHGISMCQSCSAND